MSGGEAMSVVVDSPPENAVELMAMAGGRRITIDQYHKMHEAGIYMDGDRVELIEGYVLEKHVRKPPHEAALRRLNRRLPRFLPESGWFLQVQGAVTLPADNEPEPDGVILRGDETSYDTRHPGPDDIGLAIEISDSSRAFDRRVKGRAYSRAGIPAYWVINVVDQRIEVYTDPDPAADPPAYRTHTDFTPGQSVPLVLDGQAVASISVADLLP
jgi:Uma2 family endonuclease